MSSFSRVLVVAVLGLACVFLSSCSILKFAGEAVMFTGKTAAAALRTTGAALETTGKVTTGVSKATVGFFRGKIEVPLEREGNSYYVKVRLDGDETTRLVLDTGATSVQIAPALARSLGYDLSRAERIRCSLADNRTVWARSITLEEVRVGKARVKNVDALVIESDPARDGGLLGMSFLGQFVFEIDAEKSRLFLTRK